MANPTDVHAHYCPADYRELIASSTPGLVPRLLPDGSLVVASQRFPPFPPGMHDLDDRLKRMDTAGLARQVLSVPPALLLYWADGPSAAAVSRRLNEAMATAVEEHADRFLGFGSVPLQQPDLAVEELEYAVCSLGLAGVEIGANVGGRDLDDEMFRPFLAALERLDVPALVHPCAFVGGERVANHSLALSLGFPFDTSICLARLMSAGVVDAFPSLRLCFVHGGGVVPYMKGRLDHVARWEDGQDVAPSRYLERLFLDSLVLDGDALALLVRAAGPERIVIGTDWPYAIGEPDPVRAIQSNTQLPDGAAAGILGANANRFLTGRI